MSRLGRLDDGQDNRIVGIDRMKCGSEKRGGVTPNDSTPTFRLSILLIQMNPVILSSLSLNVALRGEFALKHHR